MPTYITADSVRRTCGIASDEISDADVNSTIDEVEAQIPRYFNTAFTPTERIDILDGNGTNRIFTDKNPLLTIKELKIDGTDITLDNNVHIYKQSGKIFLDTTDGSPEESAFKDKKYCIAVKYLFGWLDESSTDTTTTSASTAGTSVALAVSSESGFSANDWVEVYGTDGNREVAQVTATDTNEVTVDALYFAHASGSKVVKLETKKIFEKVLNVVASIGLVARIVGESYENTVGYSLGELQVQKGEPYTQWRETANQLIRERDELMKRIKSRPAIAMSG